MKIQTRGEINKLPKFSNSIICPICGCEFFFLEKDIEIIIEGIPYEKGIKKILGLKQDYIYHKYISCPWCKEKLKLNYTLNG